MDQQNSHHEDVEQLPDQMLEDLQSMFDAKVLVPPDLDQQILNQATQRLGSVRSRRRRRYAVPWAAAAAVAIVAAGTWWSASETASVQVAREDVDANGRVDIMDAYILAGRLREQGAVDPKWDINSDGKVDDQDVDAIAMTAVSLIGKAS